MKKSIIIIFIEFVSSSGLGTLLLVVFSIVFLLGGILTGFDWFITLTSSYLTFPNILYLFLLFAMIFLVSYLSFMKSRPYSTVMLNSALVTTILIFIGNRFLRLFSGTQGLRSYFLDNVILYLGYIFCCTFMGVLFSAIICLFSHLTAKSRLRALKNHN